MFETVLLTIAAVLAVSAFSALFIWARRTEASVDYDRPGLSDEQANAMRFGIAMTVNQNNMGQ
ncbi:MAG: hypothetical protein M3Y89_00770 [Actinomycetota bacterium]|nr:hypothetical protein [Actinomycetota bacterium]